VNPTATVRQIIRDRAIEQAKRDKLQGTLYPPEEDFHETIRLKLDGLFDSHQFWNFSRCGHEQIYRTCKQCRKFQTFTYQCNIKWCPNCQFKITDQRRKVLQVWTQKISQPKHLVLTQRNFQILTRRKIREHTRNLAKMRRLKSFAGVRGGCVSVEITREDAGWHLHSHWLLDTDWLEMQKISTDWGMLVGQQFAICKVKDCRDKSYLQEVTKYVVKSADMARWAPQAINEFVRAIRGLRFFFSFGALHALAPAIRRELQAQKPPPPVCDCGCDEWIYESETNAVLNEIRRANRRRR
jgi:hypothetical protein